MFISFERGVPSAAMGLAGTGALVVAQPWSWPWIVGWVLVAASTILLVWGLRIRGRPWWTALWKPHPQLYLWLTPDGRPDRNKSYIVAWSPSDYLRIHWSNYAAWAGSLPPAEPEEKAFVLYLFNAGPEDARHIHVTWQIRGLDVCGAVVDTGMFGDCVHELSPGHISLHTDTQGVTRPLARRQEERFPLLRAGETMRLESPEAFTGAAAIAFLGVAKIVFDRAKAAPPTGGDLKAVLQFVQKFTARMPRVSISLAYRIGDGPEVRQEYRLEGTIRGSNVLRAVPGEQNRFETDPLGVCASVDGLRIYEDGR